MYIFYLKKVVQAVEGFSGSQRAKGLLEKLTEYPNIPRKKAKFFNFMYNSFRSYGVHDGLLGEIWTVIESFDKKPAQPAAKPTQNVSPPAPIESANKRKLDEPEIVESNKKIAISESDVMENKFDWIESAKTECLKKTNNEIIFKKLFKKV